MQLKTRFSQLMTDRYTTGQYGMNQDKLPPEQFNVLIIDDDTAIANYFSDLLTSRGYQATTFNDSVAALQHCESELDNYDLIISDVCMPGLPGDELAMKLLKINPNKPIILCSGYTDHTSSLQLKKIGIQYFIEKPVDRSRLFKIIDELQSNTTH
jgi:FixJ family two-component response regulator